LIPSLDLAGALRRDERFDIGLDLGIVLRLLDDVEQLLVVDPEEREDGLIHAAVVVILADVAVGEGFALIDGASQLDDAVQLRTDAAGVFFCKIHALRNNTYQSLVAKDWLPAGDYLIARPTNGVRRRFSSAVAPFGKTAE